LTVKIAAPKADGEFAHDVLAVVFTVRNDALSVLLWHRERAPHRGRWALPGGPLGAHERLGTSVARHLSAHLDPAHLDPAHLDAAHLDAAHLDVAQADVTQLTHLEQLETRSDPERDPRGRVLATAYLGLVPVGTDPHLPVGTAWHRLDRLPLLALDHASIIDAARDRLRGKLSYTTIAWALAPPAFTLSGLRGIYRAVLGYDVSATNLARVLGRRHALVATGALSMPGTDGGRPARTFRFAHAQVQVTDPFAAFRPPSG
jgi:ADP-ribose pyrophosphatase YjhB (NUDIX family)